jgi:outer membrane protein TolC
MRHVLRYCYILLIALLPAHGQARKAFGDSSLPSLAPPPPLSSHASGDLAAENDLFLPAQKEFRQEEYGRALEHFHEFLNIYPRSPLAPEAELYYTISRVRVRGGGEPAAQPVESALPGSPQPAQARLKLDFRHYLAGVLESDPSRRIERAEFDGIYAQTLANLQGYGWKASLDPGATVYDDRGLTYGADLTANLTRTLYDGGRQRLLQGELQIVGQLSRISLIDSGNRAALIALNIYASFFTLQQEVSLLDNNFERFRRFMQGTEQSYRLGLRFSSYEYYTAKSQFLVLERELIQKKAELLKAETAFRQYGKITDAVRLELAALSAPPPADLPGMETQALVNNSAIQAARLQRDRQEQKVEEKAAQSGATVLLRSALGVQVGSTGYIGSSTSFGYGTKPVASLGISASIPLWDGGARKSALLVEELEALKQRLVLEKTSEEVIKRLSDIYLDYLALQKDREITGELAELNRKRYQIASERFEHGLEAYRSVQEALSDATLSEIELIRQETLLQKLGLDLALLSGKKAADL